jgi:hypothetical protein
VDDSVCAFFAHTDNDGREINVKYYNLDVVILVGYRLNLKEYKISLMCKKCTLEIGQTRRIIS